MLICLSGRMRSGKDSAANLLVSELGFTRVALADKLKEFTARMLHALAPAEAIGYSVRDMIDYANTDAFKISSIGGWTGRRWLQAVGTDAGRKTFGDDFWVNQLAATLDPREDYVCTDVRFPNESVGMMRATRRSYSIRLNRADRAYQHNFTANPSLPDSCACDTGAHAICNLPRSAHPSHFSGDYHASETSMPDESNEMVHYDAVIEAPSAELAACKVVECVKGWMR